MNTTTKRRIIVATLVVDVPLIAYAAAHQSVMLLALPVLSAVTGIAFLVRTRGRSTS